MNNPNLVIPSYRIARRMAASGFTLIELVIVIAIIGILASLSIPKFLDLSGAAKQAATKGGLGTVRATLFTKYAQSATGGATASFPTSLAAADFAGAELPKNALNTFSGVNALSATVNGTATHASLGFWFISGPTNNADYGKAGAYSDSAGTNTQNY